MTRSRTAGSASLPMALTYTRVSSEEQARDGVSLDAQLAECRRYAAQHGWVLGPEFQDVLSGRRDDRPAYLALLAEARRLRAGGQPVSVVVFRLDRLGRRILERVRCREELKGLGVPVHSVREGGEVSDLVANILASVAEEESRTLGERVASAKRHVAANGWYVVGRIPWGYRSRPATPEERAAGAPNTVLDFHPNHAPWVREAFARAARGESIHAVYRWVRDLPTEARGGRTMRYEAVRKLLASPIYIARPNHGDPDVLARPLTRWPALVDDEQWALIRQRVADHRRMPRQATQQYLVTGILRCPACGERMHGHARPDGRSYRCSGSRLGAGRGRGKCYAEIRGELLEAAVLDEVARVVDTAVTSLPDMQTALARAWEALRHPENDRGGFEARRQKQLQRQAEQARVRLRKAAVLFADGDIDKMGYELLREKAREDLEAAETELERHDPAEPSVALPPLDEVLRQAGGWAEALRGGEVAAQREVLAILVERVVPRRVGYGVYEADINWTPLGHGLRTVSSPPATLAGRRAA